MRDCRDATRIEGTESGFTHGEEACPPFIAEMRPELRVLKVKYAMEAGQSGLFIAEMRPELRVLKVRPCAGEENTAMIAEMRPELRVLKEMAQHLLSIACNHCRDATRIEGTESRSYMKHLRSYMKLQRCDPN